MALLPWIGVGLWLGRLGESLGRGLVKVRVRVRFRSALGYVESCPVFRLSQTSGSESRVAGLVEELGEIGRLQLSIRLRAAVS